MTCPKCNHEVHEDSQGIIACLSCGYHEPINQVRDTATYSNKNLMKRESTNDAGEKLQYSTSFCHMCKEVTQDGERKAEDDTKWCTSCLSYKDGRIRVGTNDAGEKLQSTEDTLKERGSRYGEFRVHALRSQTLKMVLEDAHTWESMEPYMKEALSMICHKLARIANGDPTYIDSWADICGYSQLVVDELTKEQK